MGGAGRGGPEIRGDVDFEVAGCGVVEGGDDDGLVDVLGYVVENFPSAWRRDQSGLFSGEGDGLPSYSIPAHEGACQMSSSCQ